MSSTLNRKVVFDVSMAAFLKLAFIAFALLILYLVREVLLLMFLAIVIASALDPIIDFLQKKRIPRGVSVIIIYLSLLGLVVLGSGLMLPPLVEQVQQLGEILPGYLQDLSREFEGRSGLTVAQGLDQASTYISSFADRFDEALVSVYEAVYSLFGGLFSFILVFVLSFYFLIEENGFKKFIKSFVPQKQKSYVMGLVGRIQIQMGRWLRGQLFLGLVIGIVTYIVLSLLGVRYALVLAILAGLLEIVPYIGPVISAVPAILLALLESPLTALFVLIAYIIIQQLENHFLVPKIMSKAVGLNPLVIILVILAGAKIAGIGGAIVAVPAATALSVILGDVFEDRGRAEEKKKGQGGKASQKKTGAWTSLRNAFKLK